MGVDARALIFCNHINCVNWLDQFSHPHWLSSPQWDFAILLIPLISLSKMLPSSINANHQSLWMSCKVGRERMQLHSLHATNLECGNPLSLESHIAQRSDLLSSISRTLYGRTGAPLGNICCFWRCQGYVHCQNTGRVDWTAFFWHQMILSLLWL